MSQSSKPRQLAASPLPWKVYAAGPTLRPHTIEIHDAAGEEVVSWMGFDRSELKRNQHLRNAKFIVGAANAYPGLMDAVTAPFKYLRRMEKRHGR